MAKMVPSGPWIQEIFLDTTSMNTVEGVDELARLIRQNGYHRVHVVAESFHARRVALTFARRTPDLPVVMHTVHTPFGGNSQDRLNSAWRWWPWEIAARIYTFVLVH